MKRTLVLLLVFAAARFGGAAGIPVTTCGMEVRGTADLVGDLDCSAHAGDALVLDGRLRLNGFTLIGNGNPAETTAAVLCTGRCKIIGPGTITGATYGVYGDRARVYDADVSGSRKIGIAGGQSARLVRSTVTGVGTDAVIPGSQAGVEGGRMLLVDSSVTGSQGPGLWNQDRLRAVRSTITGNGVSVNYCPVGGCPDILAYRRPRLVDTACGRSQVGLTGQTWGVCSQD